MGDAATVLLIDDDESVRRASKRVLERDGLVVLEASDGHVGLRRFREDAPSAVLVDLRMPGIDGLDVLRDIVSESPETPVVVVSGAGTMTDVVEALRRGAWDFVPKPVADPEILVRSVRRGLDKALLMRQNREFRERLQEVNERLVDALYELHADEQAARQLQFQLLPEDGLRFGPYTCFRRLFPSQVLSGDFLDYFALGDRFLGLYLADVSGHGAASAFVTAMLTTLVSKYRESLVRRGDETILNPRQFLARLDADLMAHRLEKHVTMFFGVLELSSGRLVFGSAGAFPFPFVSSASDVVELECVGRPLNLPGAANFGYGEVVIGPGERLLVASDGVLELDGQRTHRETRDRLASLTRSARDIEAVLAGLEIGEPTRPSDDIALLFMQREEGHHV
jgi:serine phosphatase RsbU (regulator of sigma subunit)